MNLSKLIKDAYRKTKDKTSSVKDKAKKMKDEVDLDLEDSSVKAGKHRVNPALIGAGVGGAGALAVSSDEDDDEMEALYEALVEKLEDDEEGLSSDEKKILKILSASRISNKRRF